MVGGSAYTLLASLRATIYLGQRFTTFKYQDSHTLSVHSLYCLCTIRGGRPAKGFPLILMPRADWQALPSPQAIY